MDAFFGRDDDKFGARRGGQEDVGLRDDFAMAGAVLRAGGDAVERDDLQGLGGAVILKLDIENGVGAGVDHSP